MYSLRNILFHNSPVADFHGSPDEESLAHESHQCILEIQPMLGEWHPRRPSIIMSPEEFPSHDPIQLEKDLTNAAPQLSLVLKQELAHHSRKLDAFPRVKAAFWLTMLQTTVTPNWVERVPTTWFSKPEFPQFVLDFRGLKYPDRQSAVDESLCNAVYEQLTSPTPGVPMTEMLSLGFEFRGRSVMDPLTVEQLVEQMLDRISTHPQRICAFHSLDFSMNVMQAAELEILSRIVAKCRSGFYQVEHVVLDAIIPPHGTPLTAHPIHRKHRSPPVALPETNAPPSALRRVSLSKNFWTPSFLPKHFSVLRYGCFLQEDLTEYLAHDHWETHHAFATECWRWIAFGLFYPRPKRFAKAFKLRKLGNLICSPLTIQTIVRTLNPAAQLVYNDLTGEDTSVAESLMVCTVKAGAIIEVFVSGLGFAQTHGPNRYPEVSIVDRSYTTVVETCEFEALCERADGSMCVVVPGAGLGWVHKEFVDRVDREPLDFARSALDGRYDVTIGVGPNKDHVDELRPLFRAIGHQLGSLTFDFFLTVDKSWAYAYEFNEFAIGGSMAQIIFDHCMHLQHLRLNAPSARDVSDLLTALEGSNLRRRLLSLNLNDSEKNARKRSSRGNGDYFGDDAAARLAAILADSSDPPVLEELRLVRCAVGPEGLTSLLEALKANRSVSRIELARNGTLPSPELGPIQDRMDAALQGQVLRQFSPIDVKVAFLSAMAPRGDDAAHARHGLARDTLALILAFAASCETRHEVVWADYRSGGYDEVHLP